ncbi:N-acetylmuramic acid 6-phosphate etherase [Alphaproteobacteria bacterium]|nr:N-acetylmuramic acid 6-phosphate etherase [Alphaproteobacteria bacterium]
MTIPKTERPYQIKKPIDHLNTIDAINVMVNEHKKAALEIKKNAVSIEIAVNLIYDHLILNKKGRLIYVGAGTSGRIGVQDGVELFPTFNWPKERLDLIIAGGNQAILNAVENAEDDIISASETVKKRKINSHDVVIGLAASGDTPFTCKVLEESKNKNALTIAISNNPKGKLLKFGKVQIVLDTKEEVIAGSTRLKAGTAQKICLNIISSMIMIKMGRVKNGFMNYMFPTNEKLRKRKVMIQSKLL